MLFRFILFYTKKHTSLEFYCSVLFLIVIITFENNKVGSICTNDKMYAVYHSIFLNFTSNWLVIIVFLFLEIFKLCRYYRGLLVPSSGTPWIIFALSIVVVTKRSIVNVGNFNDLIRKLHTVYNISITSTIWYQTMMTRQLINSIYSMN